MVWPMGFGGVVLAHTWARPAHPPEFQHTLADHWGIRGNWRQLPLWLLSWFPLGVVGRAAAFRLAATAVPKRAATRAVTPACANKWDELGGGDVPRGAYLDSYPGSRAPCAIARPSKYPFSTWSQA